MLARGLAMRRAGMSWLQVATEMGCSEGAARYTLSKNRREQCKAIQARSRARKKPPLKLFPYVGQYDSETGRRSI